MLIKKYNETNGPAYGKEETTKKGLKGIPMTTENPTIFDPVPEDEDELKDEDTFNDEDISIEMDEPSPTVVKKKNKKMRRIKTFEQMNENVGPALDGEYANNKEEVKRQGKPFPKKKKSNKK